MTPVTPAVTSATCNNNNNQEDLVTSVNNRMLTGSRYNRPPSVAMDNRDVAMDNKSILNSSDNRHEPVSVTFGQETVVVTRDNMSNSKVARNNGANSKVVMETRKSRVAMDTREVEMEDRGRSRPVEQRELRQSQLSSTMKPKPVCVSCHKF